jgi:hypothetical protein
MHSFKDIQRKRPVVSAFRRAQLFTIAKGNITTYTLIHAAKTHNTVEELCWEKLNYDSAHKHSHDVFQHAELQSQIINYLSTYCCGDSACFQNVANFDSTPLIRNRIAH